MLVLSTDRAEALAYRYKTLFEQSEKLIKIAATNFDKDGNVLEESGIISTSKLAGLYSIDADGNLKAFVGATPDGVKIQGSHITLEGTVTANDNFKILEDGSISTNHAQISGTMKSSIGEVLPGHINVGGDTTINTIAQALDKNDYFIFYGNSMSGGVSDTIPLNAKYVGRKIYLMIDDQNDLTLNGRFYYGSGVQTSIFFSKQFVEMFCAKINDVIYWIVLKVIELNTSSRYGLSFKTLAYGRIKTSDLTGKVKTFDGSTLRISRYTQGVDVTAHGIRIDFPNTWFRSDSEVYVNATGIGSALNTAKYSLFANVNFACKRYIEIVVADDHLWNDGEFFFEVKNMDLF